MSVGASTASVQEAGPGASPRAALQQLVIKVVPIAVARELMVRHHYLGGVPGGTMLAFGVFLHRELVGAITFGVGPVNAYRLVKGVDRRGCAVLTRFWLSDELPRNSESKVLGVVLRALRRHTSLKFVISYADPGRGHVGIIYQATNWSYTGMSYAMPLYDMGDGVLRHSRSFSHAYGTHSVEHFKKHGVDIKVVRQGAKHRYVCLLDPSLRDKLTVSVLPYPKKETLDGRR